jgi:cation-transporting ATPase F
LTATTADDLSSCDALRLTGGSLANGLTHDKVAERLLRHGENLVKVRGGMPGWLRLMRQFTAPLVLVLIAASAVTGLLGEWVDASVILIVVIVNAIVGFLQESKAADALEALMKRVLSEAVVKRDGRKIRVNSTELVPGDIVMLAGGDRVPANIRLLETKNLRIDESSLTGESVSANKRPDPLQADTVLGDRANMAYAGSLVTAGSGTGVVWATGNRTETGRVAFLIAEAADISTQLTRRIARFNGILLWVILALAAALFAYAVLFRDGSVAGMLMTSVALAVGVNPEGLPAAITIVLAIGVNRMARRRSIIRKLPAVETLGCTTVICSDKTGTLTQNKMTLRFVFAGGETFEVGGTGYEPRGRFHDIEKNPNLIDPAARPVLQDCLHSGMLGNDSAIIEKDGVRSIAEARTAVVNCVVAVASAYLINCRSLRRSIFSIGWFTNPLLWFGICFTALLHIGFTYSPLMNRLLHTSPVDAAAWLRILAVAASAFALVELEKMMRRRLTKPISQ